MKEDFKTNFIIKIQISKEEEKGGKDDEEEKLYLLS